MICRVLLHLVIVLLLSLNGAFLCRPKVFLDGRSINETFSCECGGSSTLPLYWSINDLVFAHYSLPEVFMVPDDREYVILPQVDRGVSGWRLQCICREIRGTCHNISVLGGLQNSDTEESLMPQPFERGPALEYRALGADLDRNVTISWSYHPQSTTSTSCSTVERYNISVYPFHVVHAAISQGFNLPVPRETLSSMEKRINISRELLDGNYLQISAIHHDDCNLSVTTAPFLYGYSPNAITTHIRANGADSVTFELPELLQNNSSLQLIWQKNESSQHHCVCPLDQQLLSRCACNVQNPDNTVAIVNGTSLTVSNLTQVMEKGISVVLTVLSGHLNLRTVIKIVRIEDIINGVPTTTRDASTTTSDASTTTSEASTTTSEAPITTSDTADTTTSDAAKEIGGILGELVVLASITLAITLYLVSNR